MIPEHTKYALSEWVRWGNQHDHGSFLMAIVSNDLMESYKCADDINLHYMYDIVKWMYNNLPAQCYGSVEKSKKWTGLSDADFFAWEERITARESMQ